MRNEVENLIDLSGQLPSSHQLSTLLETRFVHVTFDAFVESLNALLDELSSVCCCPSWALDSQGEDSVTIGENGTASHCIGELEIVGPNILSSWETLSFRSLFMFIAVRAKWPFVKGGLAVCFCSVYYAILLRDLANQATRLALWCQTG